jgi:RNA polymerase sigma-70 factor (ECF subfamily)
MYSEKELIEGCIKGNRVYQKALYDRYCRKMMVICQRYSKSLGEAEDCLQEGFIKVFNNIKSFKGESKVETWITRIMINTSLNAQRQKLYLLPMVDIDEVQMISDEKINLSSMHLKELLNMVQSLPDGCRIVFNLFAIEGYSHKEIGEMMGISEGTSKSQFNRAKSLLKSKLELYKYERFGDAKL